ncbi:Membrane associated serine protease, rhomboid family [Amycolatopsis tolypomycina]|uniref:Membrane associated serine protease, rhomboid family n=1 Tax=Amycolatopsis tolypomycina TaxID=208445 RepID=A0A1H4J3W7_9PSEU|nr:rhomboid family intramembrane serine protease [Amycolatopsis tolypomycina]SEB41039.1 Membrane associated serine protease, rhomboid family [Amycolatopsis tolypomycina]
MNQPPNPAAEQAALPGCWWHPNRPTGLSCSRCGRPACPDCLREAPVGFHCTDCVHSGGQEQRRQHRGYQDAGFGQRTVFGARLSQSVLVTQVILAVNVLVFLATVLQAQSLNDNDLSSLFQYGALYGDATMGHGEWWRVLTNGFLHYGPIHIAVNMFSLWMMGRSLEQVTGRGRYLALYFVSMLGASTAVLLFGNPAGFPGTAGASGALFGLMGAYGVTVLKLRLNPTGLIITLALNAFITFGIPGISIFGHLGGLVTGALVTIALLYAPQVKQARWQAIGIGIIVVALLGLLVYRGAQASPTTCDFVQYREGLYYTCR